MPKRTEGASTQAGGNPSRHEPLARFPREERKSAAPAIEKALHELIWVNGGGILRCNWAHPAGVACKGQAENDFRSGMHQTPKDFGAEPCRLLKLLPFQGGERPLGLFPNMVLQHSSAILTVIW